MSTIGEVYDPNKQKTLWYDAGKDPGIKVADKAENKVTADAYDYSDTTKAGVDDAKLKRNAEEFAKITLLSVVPKFIKNGPKDEILFIKCMQKAQGLHEKYAAGKMSKLELASEMGLFIAKEYASRAANLETFGPATTMLQAVMKAVPLTLADQKMDEQLHHDERIRLHVAEHFKSSMPECTHAAADREMSVFGRTHRKTDTFEAVQAGFESALKADPAACAAMERRFWHGKSAALDLGIKDQKDLARVLDPNNTAKSAVAFREMWNNKTNVAFRLGVTAMIDEQNAVTDKDKALYAADVARYRADKAAFESKTVPVKP